MSARPSRTSYAATFIAIVAAAVMVAVTVLSTAIPSHATATGWVLHGYYKEGDVFGSFEYEKNGYEGRQWFCALRSTSTGPIFPEVKPDSYPHSNLKRNMTTLEDNAVAMANGSVIHPHVDADTVSAISYVIWQHRNIWEENYWLGTSLPVVFKRLAGVGTGSRQESKLADNQKKLVEETVADAQRNHGPDTISMDLAPSELNRSFAITNLGVISKNGYYFDGGKAKNSLTIELELKGPAVFTKNNGKKLQVPLSDQAQSVDAVAVGTGPVTVAAHVSNLPSTALDIWYGSGHTTTNKPLQPVMSYGSPTSAHREKQIHVAKQYEPSIATAVNQKRLDPKTALVDTVSVAPSEDWPMNDGKPAKLVGRATLYGPYPSPEAPRAKKESDKQHAVASRDIVLDRPGADYRVAFDADSTAKPGFYTIGIDIDASREENAPYRIKDYSSLLWEESETAVQPFIPRIETVVETSGGQQPHETLLSDKIVVSGLPDDHGSFDGLGPWAGDAKSFDHYLYCLPPGKPKDIGVTRTMKPLAKTSIAAANGTYRMSAAADGKALSTANHVCRGHFVFIADYPGDGRTQAVRTREDDPLETYIPPVPHVATKAEAANKQKGRATLSDTIIVTSGASMPSTYEVTSRLYRWDIGTKPTCTAQTQVFAAQPIRVDKPGTYKTESTTLTNPRGGMYGWVETMVDTATGATVHEGVCGHKDETVQVDPVSITTKARASTPGVPEEKDGKFSDAATGHIGSQLYDTIKVSGHIPAGSQLKANLFRNAPGEKLSCDKPVWTSKTIPVIDPAQTEYETDKTVAHQAGVYHFQEQLLDAQGNVIATGKCGVSNETVVVDNPTVTTVAAEHEENSNSDANRDSSINAREKIHDRVIAHTPLPQGAHVVVELFKNKLGDKPTCDKPVWTSKKMAVKTAAPHTLATEPVAVDEPGTYHFRQKVVYRGKIISQDICGAPTETVTIPERVSAPPLATTGTSSRWFAIGALCAIVAGGTMLMQRRRSRKTM